MSYFLAELYSPKPAWLALSAAQRNDYFASIGPAVAALCDSGTEIIAMGEVSPGKSHTAVQSFFALWKFPDKASLDALLDGIGASGWYEYFETVNASGVGCDFPTHLSQLLALSPQSSL